MVGRAEHVVDAERTGLPSLNLGESLAPGLGNLMDTAATSAARATKRQTGYRGTSLQSISLGPGGVCL